MLHQRGVYHRDLKPKNLIVPSKKDRSVAPLVFVDLGNALAGSPDDPEEEGSETWEGRLHDYAGLASLFADGMGFGRPGWTAWLRRAPKTPAIRRFLEAWNLPDTLEEEVERYRACMREEGDSEAYIEASVAVLYPASQVRCWLSLSTRLTITRQGFQRPV